MRIASLLLSVALLPAIATAAEIPKGSMQWITKTTAGTAGNADFRLPALSGDGKTMAATTVASNLGTGTYNGFHQVMGYRSNGKFMGSLSKNSLGQMANLDCSAAALSKNGRYIAFESNSTFGILGVPGGYSQVFWRDTQTQELKLASIGPSGNIPTAFVNIQGISDDGRYVLFRTRAGNLVPNDDFLTFRGYVRDMKLGVTQLVTVTDAGFPLDESVYDMRLSGNGRYVFFSSDDPKLGYGKDLQVYVRDRKLGTTTLISKNAAGIQGAAYSELLAISSNARYVVMYTTSLNLGFPLLQGNLVLLDRKKNEMRALDVAIPGMKLEITAGIVTISNDGRRLFNAMQLLETATNQRSTAIYEYDLKTGNRWKVTSVPEDYHNAYLIFRASANGDRVFFTTEVDIQESNGKIDGYLYRAH